MSWETTGNAGTDPTANFLGTTDGQPVVIRTANLERLRVDGGSSLRTAVPHGPPIATLGWASLQLSYVDTSLLESQFGDGTGTWVIKASDAGLEFQGPGSVLIEREGVAWSTNQEPTISSESLVITHTENGRAPGVTFENNGGGHFVQQFVFGQNSNLPGNVAASLWANWNGLVIAGNSQLSWVIGDLDNSPVVNITSGGVGVQGILTVSGDIILTGGADCAEEFDADELGEIEPGTVMVINGNGAVAQCEQAYDKRVAGVVSGAGEYKAAITLDKQRDSNKKRVPLALIGKVYVKVDADAAPIETGDLLTTSATLGHAMKATDATKSFGTIIGKALKSLQQGRGLLPILVTLQ